ncbi:hypothetical protein AVEN_127738-1 [Araneus ventricosus]|uniref:Uncharacterized protein n=1 Tax=Araneus ventricosus TaxID=182803 RepID=A0A4Y2EEQ8_ARAVE|nr:hypothetical protein AVEN_127738-1 [Araneus ventricosus]
MTAAATASSIEAGVLVAHRRATALTRPKEVRTITGTQSPTITIPTGKRLPAYLSGSKSYLWTLCAPLWETSIASGSCNNPPFYWDTTCHQKWAQRATPPLLCHRVDESLLTYTADSPPRTHGVPPMGSRYVYRAFCYWMNKLRGMVVDIKRNKNCNGTWCHKPR